MSMSIHDEAVTAALKATNEGGYHHITGVSVVVILEAAAPHMLKDLRQMTLVEIAARDRPEQMEAARAKVRADRKASLAEQFRIARESAWQEGMLSQFEADLLGKSSPDNPHTKKEADQ